MREKIEAWVGEFVKEYRESSQTESQWQEPLVGFADAADKGFLELKERVSPTHALPEDFLEDAQTVVAFFIPFAPEIPVSNQGGTEASREWAVAYIETNQLILQLNTYICRQLEKEGYRGTVIPATHNFSKETLLSDWSHRHVAYLAGLGSFGLNNMLITEKGCCGRIGSLVTNAKVAADSIVRGENCLYKHNGTCRKCAASCVHEALHLTGFDRHRCYEKCLENAAAHKELGLADVCGKCLVKMPCSTQNPAGRLRNRG